MEFSKIVDNKIIELKLQIDQKEWSINVQSFCVRRSNDISNVGFIIEEYRKRLNEGISDADDYLKGNDDIIRKNISRLLNPINETPDYIQIIGTTNPLRNNIINEFSLKMLEDVADFNKADYSDSFFKRDKFLSIRDQTEIDYEPQENYIYLKPQKFLGKIKSLWIIDDTIDTGRTIEIFLRKLYYSDLLDTQTKISCFIIYNNMKMDTWQKKFKNLEDLRNKIF